MMDKERFQQEINASLPSISHETSVDTKTDKYHSILENIIDKLAPLRKKRLQQEMKQPWYDEQVTNGVWLKCMKERKWKDSGNEYDYVALQYQKRHVRKVMYANKSNTTMTCSPTSVEIPKDYMQKPISYYSEKKPYHCQKRKTQKY